MVEKDFWVCRVFKQVFSNRAFEGGERVLALAWLENPNARADGLGPSDLPETLIMPGLIGLLDPPRKDAIEAIKDCHGGNIRVTMITGDHRAEWLSVLLG